MAIIKCKMCGGDLKVVEGESVCECEYCGSRQTVPSADNEKKMTLFSRASRLLRNCEFDKAAGVFESVVADFPEEAEAYWGLVLCKYGIEYVDDPATGKKIPTCHRSSFDSVLDDSNFEQACENADAVARRVYRDEARAIEELRKGIIEVSGKEEPYDIFISYKETDEHGERTLDSVIAQDIYKELTSEGYRVFFSRISLEGKLGIEYEPYIFAAINSAKVMIVVGTDYENFDAVWVKNEWGRFLKLITSGQKKTLIPVFKNMDAYDMPKEFAKLSAQDMGKVGAMQDLVRGVEKLVKNDKSAEHKKETQSATDEKALLRRGQLFLEERNWEKVIEYCERALDINPESGEAYLLRELAERKCLNIETLARDYFDKRYNESNSLKKARRFSNDIVAKDLLIFDSYRKEKLQENQAVRKQKETSPKLQELAVELKKIRETASFFEERIILRNGTVILLNEDGTVSLSGNIKGVDKAKEGIFGYGKYDYSEAKEWRGILSIIEAEGHLIGLTVDGKVLVTGLKLKDSFQEKGLTNWTDVKEIVLRYSSIIGITKQGRVLGPIETDKNSENKSNTAGLQDVDSLLECDNRAIFKRTDGTLCAAEFVGNPSEDYSGWDEIQHWKNIEQLENASGRVIGLKQDGSLIATRQHFDDWPDKWPGISGWKDVVCIEEACHGVVALSKYGDVLYYDSHDTFYGVVYATKEMVEWKNIAKLYFGENWAAGLTKDGTFMVHLNPTPNDYISSQTRALFTSKISKWKNLAGFTYCNGVFVGIKKDGKLLCAGAGEQNKEIENLCISTHELTPDYTDVWRKKMRNQAEAEFIKRKKKQEIDEKIEEIEKKYKLKTDILQQEMDKAISEVEKQRSTIREKIKDLSTEQSSLGLFKGKEKKALQVQIDEQQERLKNIPVIDEIKKRFRPQFDIIAKDKKTEIEKVTDEINSNYEI